MNRFYLYQDNIKTMSVLYNIASHKYYNIIKNKYKIDDVITAGVHLIRLIDQLKNSPEESRNVEIEDELSYGMRDTMGDIIKNEPVDEIKGIDGIKDMHADEIKNGDEIKNSVYDAKWQNLTERTSTCLITLSNKIDKIASAVSGSSASKGKFAENLIIGNICKNFPDASVDDTRYVAGRGDIIVKIDDCSIMLEIKNYVANVPASEIKKFKLAIQKNKYDVGILVSCNSGIVGKKDKMIYDTDDTALCIYLSNAGYDGCSIAWAILFSLGVKKIFKDVENITDEKRTILLAHVKSKLSALQDCVDMHYNLKSLVLDMQSKIIQTMSLTVGELECQIDRNKHNISAIVTQLRELVETGKMTSVTLLPGPSESLSDMTLSQLGDIAKQLKIKGRSSMKKNELIKNIKIIRGES